MITMNGSTTNNRKLTVNGKPSSSSNSNNKSLIWRQIPLLAVCLCVVLSLFANRSAFGTLLEDSVDEQVLQGAPPLNNNNIRRVKEKSEDEATEAAEEESPEEEERQQREEEPINTYNGNDHRQPIMIIPNDKLGQDASTMVEETAVEEVEEKTQEVGEPSSQEEYLAVGMHKATPCSSNNNKNSNYKFCREEPLFIFSLPNSANLVWPRYFECANLPGDEVGRYWRQQQFTGQTIGGCFAQEQQDWSNCGNFSVWMELQQLVGPQLRLTKKDPECFDPLLYPDAIDKLAQSWPKGGTILNVIRDPVEWYSTLPKDYPDYWNQWCNPSHGKVFPPPDYMTEEYYLQFYQGYQNRLKTFVEDHPSWRYIEVDLRESTPSVATMLSQNLGVSEHCWTQSYHARVSDLPPDDTNTVPAVPPHQPLPNDWRFPIFVTGLPKSGTSTVHTYFMSALGKWASAHQQMYNLRDRRLTSIGECMLYNLEHKHNHSLFQDCGHARVFSDAGFLKGGKDRICWMPTIHGALDEFYNSYPNATILHIHRNVSAWYSSARRWSNDFLENKLSSSSLCGPKKGFPPPNSSQQVWEEWYRAHNDRIRSFAAAYPSLTYLEIPIDAMHAKPILHQAFGYHEGLWKHSNVNKKKMSTKQQ